MIKPATIDFETKPIGKRPDAYPPEPVGLAISVQGKNKYLAWGHEVGNNCDKSEAFKVLKQLYSKYPILCHNGRFDLEVSEKYFGMPLVPHKGWHDSMLLVFLFNPREPTLKLKELADKWLDMKPQEQDELRDWIYNNVPGAKKAKSKWGEHIWKAPVSMVGKYAKGDVIRTRKLWEKFYPYVIEMGMLEQYEIEKRVAIKAIEMEREGVNIDIATLEPDLIKAKRALKRYGREIFKVTGEINLNSPKQKAETFERLGLVDEWIYTDKGNPSTSMENLILVCNDKQLVRNLDMFSRYTKLIGTYMEPWLTSAQENKGKFYPWFNTIKGDNDKGTYTGRFSSNFQQVPREPLKGYKHLPFLRNYIIPDKKSHLLYNRDFSGQEIRILAHYEQGQLLEAYNANANLDPHSFVKNIIESNDGITLERSHVKSCNFLIVYGGGPMALAKNIKVSENKARKIFRLHANAMPGVSELKGELQRMANKGELFQTAGGRVYDFEDGKEYVALNTLIQGSAADHSKRALLNIDDMLQAEHPDARIMLTVHDEFMVTGPKRGKVKLMRDFKAAMEINSLFDLPMLTDGKIGECWGKMEKVK